MAGATSSPGEFLGVWLLGGLVSLCGALVYAELASRFPETGGEYVFLTRGLGSGAGFVFAWSRMTVIQTGAIAAVAFVFGDYASELLPLGERGPAIYAALSVAALTALNLAGTVPSKTLQRGLQALLFLGLLLIGAIGLTSEPPPPAAAPEGRGGLGLAMIFVLLTYGGWNESVYLAGEVRKPRRSMAWILVGGILVVTSVYLLVNAGYLVALGLEGIRESKAVAADLIRDTLGGAGARWMALLVCLASLSTMNAALFTGARSTWAMGRDFPEFGSLGRWRAAGSTPAAALLLQALVTLALVAAAATTPDGFTAMVAYTSPVFWTFFLLTAATLFVFRWRGEPIPSFGVPLYPFVPLAFCATCLFMLVSAVDYVRDPTFGPSFGPLVLGGLAVMAAGLPVYRLVRPQRP